MPERSSLPPPIIGLRLLEDENIEIALAQEADLAHVHTFSDQPFLLVGKKPARLPGSPCLPPAGTLAGRPHPAALPRHPSCGPVQARSECSARGGADGLSSQTERSD